MIDDSTKLAKFQITYIFLFTQEWLVLTPRDKMPQPEKEFFPRPPKREDGSYIYDRVPGYAGQTPTGPGSGHHHHPQMLYKKRAYEEAPQR